MKEHSKLLAITMGAIYPLVIIFGLYIIVNGHHTPGGGFQGGAILSSVFIIQYFTTFDKYISLHTLNDIEKILYLSLVIIAIVFILENNSYLNPFQKEYFMLIMNILIGLKVFCGLSIIFYRFVLFESR